MSNTNSDGYATQRGIKSDIPARTVGNWWEEGAGTAMAQQSGFRQVLGDLVPATLATAAAALVVAVLVGGSMGGIRAAVGADGRALPTVVASPAPAVADGDVTVHARPSLARPSSLFGLSPIPPSSGAPVPEPAAVLGFAAERPVPLPGSSAAAARTVPVTGGVIPPAAPTPTAATPVPSTLVAPPPSKPRSKKPKPRTTAEATYEAAFARPVSARPVSARPASVAYRAADPDARSENHAGRDRRDHVEDRADGRTLGNGPPAHASARGERR